VAAGWGEAAEAPRCATVLVLRRGGTAPMAGGSGRAAHPPSAPTRPAGRTTGVEGGRPRGVWRRRRWRRRYPAAGRVGRSREQWKRRLAACEGPSLHANTGSIRSWMSSELSAFRGLPGFRIEVRLPALHAVDAVDGSSLCSAGPRSIVRSSRWEAEAQGSVETGGGGGSRRSPKTGEAEEPEGDRRVVWIRWDWEVEDGGDGGAAVRHWET
jgi:hypothetical protein